ncbi:MAG: relaxase/mobilization nuclease domain-containing protein [Acutalibacteraceae bacterium]
MAREQFVTVKEQFDKTDGIQAYHGYLSFKETDITPELAQHIGMAVRRIPFGARNIKCW